MTIRGFTRCDECEGRGFYMAWHQTTDADGKQTPHECPSCSGSGLVPTEKLREEAIAAVPLRHRHVVIAETVDAVLAKVAEHLGDRE